MSASPWLALLCGVCLHLGTLSCAQCVVVALLLLLLLLFSECSCSRLCLQGESMNAQGTVVDSNPDSEMTIYPSMDTNDLMFPGAATKGKATGTWVNGIWYPSDSMSEEQEGSPTA